MDYDVLISGGGPAGLIAAAAFGAAGFQVLCVDPAHPVTARDAEGADLRTTAFLQPGRDLLEQAGLWNTLAPHATALKTMRIVDTAGQATNAPVTRDFNAAELSDQPFGWNLPNWLIRREGLARLTALDNVTFKAGTAAKDLFTRTNEARVGLSDGTRPRVRLVIAADGRQSPMRRAAGIDVTVQRYGQKALAFAVKHDLPHQNVSTEIHRSGGPFTLVPLPDDDGAPSSAVVWMERGPEIARLANIPVTEFEAEMTERSCEVLGRLRLATRRAVWPITSQIAHRLAGQRLVLMAEAAHAMPPIGAQGLNTSLSDLRCLLDLALASPATLGDAAMCDAYHNARMPQIKLRMRGIDLLNRTSMAASRPLQGLRAMGLQALHDTPGIRRAIMKLGLDTP